MNKNLDIISQIEGWSKRGIYIDYTTTDQYANGNKKLVDNGYYQRYSYGVCINDDNDFISELRYDDLREGLQDALDYANKNLGDYHK